MGGDGIGNALAAAQPGADELVGVSPVDLGTGRTLGGTAGLARDGQDPAGLVDGGVAVQQFPGGAVDVIDAATQQNRLQTAARVPGGARGDGRWTKAVLLSSGPCGRWWTSGGNLRPGAEVVGFAGQRCYAASGLARVACRSGGALVCGVGTVTGHPVTHQPGTSRSSLAARGSVCLGIYPC